MSKYLVVAVFISIAYTGIGADGDFVRIHAEERARLKVIMETVLGRAITNVPTLKDTSSRDWMIVFNGVDGFQPRNLESCAPMTSAKEYKLDLVRGSAETHSTIEARIVVGADTIEAAGGLYEILGRTAYILKTNDFYAIAYGPGDYCFGRSLGNVADPAKAGRLFFLRGNIGVVLTSAAPTNLISIARAADHALLTVHAPKVETSDNTGTAEGKKKCIKVMTELAQLREYALLKYQRRSGAAVSTNELAIAAQDQGQKIEHLVCPEGGAYTFIDEGPGEAIKCSIHGIFR